MELTKKNIEDMLMSDDRWLCRALVALNNRQTRDEQSSETTKYHNERGFRPCHAKKGTGMANWYTTKGFLTPKQIAWWRKVTDSGKPRILVYAGQLLIVAQEKQQLTD